MDWTQVLPIAATVLSALIGAGWLAREGDRSKIAKDIEAWNKAPESAQPYLESLIERRAKRMDTFEAQPMTPFRLYVQFVIPMAFFCLWLMAYQYIATHKNQPSWLLIFAYICFTASGSLTITYCLVAANNYHRRKYGK